jgi:fermentation-respiration switch protein FrsA (DUF1100 family)
MARPARSWKRRIGLGLAGLAACAGAVLGTAGWIGSERAIHPAAQTYRWRLSDYPELRPVPVRFRSRTGTDIAASFFPGASRAAVVLSHGYGDNQAQMLPFAAFLHRAGFATLAYDMRNRGASGGATVTLGVLERDDLISAVDALAARPEVDGTRIGAFGLSLGGATTLLAAAADPRIRAVVDDSGFADAPSVITSSFEHFIGLPAFPFAPVTIAIAEWRTGLHIGGVRPIDAVPRIAPRPLLVIHCRPDRVVSLADSERLFAAAGEPKEIWRIPQGGHAQGHTVARAEYERRVVDFFRRALRQ